MDHYGSGDIPVLLYATAHEPAILPALIDVIKGSQNKAAIVSVVTQSNGDWNVIMLAACYQPKTLDYILPLIKSLPIEDQCNIFLQKKHSGL